MSQEYERARAIFKFALDNIPKSKTESLYQAFVAFEKQHGDREVACRSCYCWGGVVGSHCTATARSPGSLPFSETCDHLQLRDKSLTARLHTSPERCGGRGGGMLRVR